MSHRLHIALFILAATGTARSSSADTAINFFGDIAYNVARHDETSNSFQAATLDIFAMQKEGKFGFMGEIVGEAFGSNDIELDIDRLEASYEPRPWLRFRAGRLRTAWGYYGDAYQNGKFFMVPVVWPDSYESFTQDGVLPAHSVGIHVDGSYVLGEQAGKLTGDAEVLNGRGSKLDGVSTFADENNGKAVNVRLRYVGTGRLDGLFIGGNAYVDQIPGDPETGSPAMHELILGAHAAYIAHRVHAIAEVAWFRHRANGMPMIYGTVNAFAEAGYHVKEDWTPYVRYEHTVFAKNDDPYFAELTQETFLKNRFSTGVKYAASASVAFKIQGSVQKDDANLNYIAIVQAAFAF